MFQKISIPRHAASYLLIRKDSISWPRFCTVHNVIQASLCNLPGYLASQPFVPTDLSTISQYAMTTDSESHLNSNSPLPTIRSTIQPRGYLMLRKFICACIFSCEVTGPAHLGAARLGSTRRWIKGIWKHVSTNLRPYSSTEPFIDSPAMEIADQNEVFPELYAHGVLLETVEDE